MVPLAPGRKDRARTAHRDKVAHFWLGDNGKAYCEEHGVDEGVGWRMWCQSPPVFAGGVESCDRQWPGSRDECARRERLQRYAQEHLECAARASSDEEQARRRWVAAREAAMEDMEDEDQEAFYQRESRLHWAMLSDDQLEQEMNERARRWHDADAWLRRCGRGLSARRARGPRAHRRARWGLSGSLGVARDRTL